MNKEDKIYIAGHKGLVGSSIFRKLKGLGYENIISRNHAELDLLNFNEVEEFFQIEKPDYVFLAAAKVGGIQANNRYPADFIYENLQIQNNVIYCSFRNKVKKLLFLGSSCIYPKDCLQPIKEEHLLTGSLETTNEPYAIAKIAGIKMCQSFNRQYETNFIACMPTNLYGPHDNFDLETSHVLPALIRKFHEAKEEKKDKVVIWGSGKPSREFLYVDDLADACLFLMEHFNPTIEENEAGKLFFNVGTGRDLSILELAQIIRSVVGYNGKIDFDLSKPDGTKQKCLDVSKLKNLGWVPKVGLDEGIEKTYMWYLENISGI